MSENKKAAPAPKSSPDKQIPNNVIPMGSHKCHAEDCKKSPERANFCGEHYTWFKEGLITLEGYKARDFDKKYHAYMLRQKKAG